MRRRLAILIGIFAGVAVAAGGSLAAPPKEPTCVPEGNKLTISADDVRFDKDCLMAPADEAFTIAFNNKEVEPHNVAIYDKARIPVYSWPAQLAVAASAAVALGEIAG